MAFRVLPVISSFIASATLAAAVPGPGDGRFIPGSELDGTWEGILSNGGMGLPIILVIATVPEQGTHAILDVMDPAAKDIPVASYRREKDTVFMEIPAIGGKFDGLVSGDLAAISGRWTQTGAAGSPVPLILHRKAP